jgi:hypothetical protein
MTPLRTKILLRLKRYGPGEFRGTLGAIIWWYLASVYTHNNIAIGYAGARWENFWYYWYFIWKEYQEQHDLYRKHVTPLSLFKGIASEFGAGEILDTAVIRPFMMGRWASLGGAWGLLLGKLCADAIFYLSATFLYLRKTKRNIDVRLTDLHEKVR